MKQNKRSTPVGIPTVADTGFASGWAKLVPFFLGFPLILFISLGSVSTVKAVTLMAGITAVVAGLAAFRRLRDRMSLPFVLLFAFVLVDGISTFYALSGKFALYEYLKVLLAFCLGTLMLALTPKDVHRAGRSIAVMLTAAAAVASVVSVDLVSTHWLSNGFIGILNQFSQDYSELTMLVPGVRINSLFENPNVFAGCSGIAVLLGLGLASSAEQRREKTIHLVLLFVNALAFLLVFSRGASAVIVLAFAAVLAYTDRERRAGLLVLMVETLILCIGCAAVISSTSFHAWRSIQPIPLLCAALGAAALCFFDWAVGSRLAKRFRKRRTHRGVMCIALVAALVIVLILAFLWTGPAKVQSGDDLYRALSPEPGAYTVRIRSDHPMSIIIQTQSKEEAIMQTRTLLFEGRADNVDFIVPEDAVVVHLRFHAYEDTLLTEAILSGESGDIAIPLRYRLLPSFVVERLQGIRANDNLILRFVYFSDGLKLFCHRPLIGSGMGSFENAVKSVQSFYYETKYAHNHYIQVLVETGIIGLLLFLALLGVSFLALLRGRKSERADPMIPALAGALVFMAGHALLEITFSSYAFLPFAFGVLAIVNVTCGGALPQLGMRTRTAVLPLMLLWVVIYTVLLGRNMQAAKLVSEKRSMDSLVEAVEMDRFEWADYALSYVYSAANPEVGATVRYHADRFAEQLEEVDSNTIPIYLAEYYFQTDRVDRAFEMLNQYVFYVASDAEGWQRAFDLAEAYEQDTDLYREQVLRIADLMDQWNADHMGTLTIREESRAFINKLREQHANQAAREPSV